MDSSASSSAPAFAGLTPSQAMPNKKGSSEKNPARRKPNNAVNTTNNAEPSSSSSPEQQMPKSGGGRTGRSRRNNRTKKRQTNGGNQTEGETKSSNNVIGQTASQNREKQEEAKPKASDGASQQNVKNNKKEEKKGRNKNNKPRNQRKKKHPWRRFIPQGTVDPITLDDLNTLAYPPFALVSDEPYIPVPIWPVPEEDKHSAATPNELDLEELNRRRIQEQWGKPLAATPNEENDNKEPSARPLGKRYFNLYDGRALAYYLVSQLQFIDPLNRRDLTRDELLNLDDYLQRHGFKDLRVTEAYDAKGITISTAGATASTAQGRAGILQQMASNLLNSLFGGRPNAQSHSRSQPVASSSSSQQTSSIQDQYAALRLREEELARQREQQRGRGLNPNATPFGEGAVYASEDGAFMVIDDDENPGLRGGDYSAATTQSAPFYSAQHIASRYGQGNLSGADAFPALPTPSANDSVPQPPAPAPAPTKKSSKTLSRITGAVKKTDPTEAQRQWEAREEARKKAMLANLSFGIDPSKINGMQQQGIPMPPPGLTTANAQVSDDKLERNKAFAEALGVKPATLRNKFNAGWARPTESRADLDEFGNELNAAVYPEALIVEARERMGLLLRLEKKWKTFLADDRAASMPLNPMDRPSRKFVHEYSDFWNLRTESFDPEPKRYIHCVKMLDTHMPCPLLSDAVRSWRRPLSVVLPKAPAKSLASDHASQQTAGQSTRSREIPPPPERMPLGEQKTEEPRNFIAVEEGGFAYGDADQLNPSFNSLFAGRERPKLELEKRTVPLELPPFQPDKGFNVAEDLQQRQVRLEEQARKKREAAERKRRVLEEAFASDDEDGAQSSCSEWEESEPLYAASDDE